MSDTPAVYHTPACWCRRCDNAHRVALARSGATPADIISLGSRFIVCPDCGNKRCPKGTNHELACTNSNEPGQKGSEYEYAAGFTALPAPAEAPAPALLSAERLAEIQADDVQLLADYQRFSMVPQPIEEDRRDLLAHVAALTAQVAGLKVELAEQEKEKFQLIRELSLAVGSSPVAAR